MRHRGFSHIGLSTLDLDKTREFYEGVLGFAVVVADTVTIKEGGRIRHIFFDAGRDQLIAFMEPRGVPDVPMEYDAGINRGLGVPASFYHFAFEAGSEAALADKRDDLRAKGVDVTHCVGRRKRARSVRQRLARFSATLQAPLAAMPSITNKTSSTIPALVVGVVVRDVAAAVVPQAVRRHGDRDRR